MKLFILIFMSIATFASDLTCTSAVEEKNNEELKMQQLSTQLDEIKLIGIKVRTSFDAERNVEQGNISPCVQRYFHGQLFEKIPNRKKPGTTYCVYTEYETDYQGAYTYFIGEEVCSLENVPCDLTALTIPSQSYVKFTTKPGPMPNVLVDAWQKIWKMSSRDLGGLRRYHTDFEKYDERASDHNNVVLDLFIGIE